MKTINTKDILEIVGGITLVASLIFVGAQLYLDRNIAVSESYTLSLESRKEDIRARMQSESYMKRRVASWEMEPKPSFWSSYLSYVEEPLITDPELVWAQFFSERLQWLEYESVYFRYQQGLIPEIMWNGVRQAIVEGSRNPFRRAVWENSTDGQIAGVMRAIIAESEH